MWENAHDVYVESRVLSADGLELIRLLYQACISAVREARRHLAEGEIRARCQSITKAWDILAELSHSLNRDLGGDIAHRLAQLYDYMQCRLLTANMEQADAPLVEVLGLLSTLSEAWDEIAKPQEMPVSASNPWETSASSTEHLWSL